MAGSQLGLLLLLLLLLTTHPESSRAQHWSHGWYPGGKRASSLPQEAQRAPWLAGRVLSTAAGRPGQISSGLSRDALPTPENRMPLKGRVVVERHLRGKRHLLQALLPGPRAPRPAPQ